MQDINVPTAAEFTKAAKTSLLPSVKTASLATQVSYAKLIVLTTYNRQHRFKMITAQHSYRTYKDLSVYQKARSTVVGLIDYYADKRLGWTEKYLVDQLIRAAASIGANLAEGYGRMYRKDYRRFVAISRGSSFEVEYWIDLITQARPFDEKFFLGILQTNEEVIKMLTSMMKALGK